MALIHTTAGDIDEALLERSTGTIDNDVERTTWVEYRLNGEIVRRDVDMYLKQACLMEGVAHHG